MIQIKSHTHSYIYIRKKNQKKVQKNINGARSKKKMHDELKPAMSTSDPKDVFHLKSHFNNLGHEEQPILGSFIYRVLP